MAITKALVDRMAKAALAQLCASPVTLIYNGIACVGAKMDERTERKYRPAGYDRGHRMTWIGAVADFRGGLPTGRPLVQVNGESLRAVACEPDSCNGMVRVELSDPSSD